MSTAHQQRSRATRARILEAAKTCFAREGYDAASVAEICQQAGVGKGGFYYHFPSKQALFLELLNGWLAELDALLAAEQAKAGSAPNRLMAMAGLMPQVAQAAVGQLPLFLEYLLQALRHPSIWKATIAPIRRYRRLFARLVAAGQSEGAIRQVEAELAARVIVALALGDLLQDVLEDRGRRGGRQAAGSLELLLTGLEKKGTA